MTDSRVRVATCHDNAEAVLVRAALEAHGIHAFVSGEHRALVAGLAMAVITLDVWVDRDDAEEAAALIAELREGGAAALADDEIPADDTAERQDEAGAAVAVVAPDTLTRLGKKKRMALAVTVGLALQHGTAHLSARAWKRGLALAAVQIVGWRHLAAGNLVTATTLLVGAVVVDVVGALVAIARSAPPGSEALPPAKIDPRARRA